MVWNGGVAKNFARARALVLLHLSRTKSQLFPPRGGRSEFPPPLYLQRSQPAPPTPLRVNWCKLAHYQFSFSIRSGDSGSAQVYINTGYRLWHSTFVSGHVTDVEIFVRGNACKRLYWSNAWSQEEEKIKQALRYIGDSENYSTWNLY